MDKNKLIDASKEAMGRSYSPYSKFKVGAAVITKDGKIYKAANIENSSYGLCMCAERNALYAAYNDGVKKQDIEAIAVIGKTTNPITPCGACRQVMSELMPKESVVIMTNLEGHVNEQTVSQLLPLAFDDTDL